MKIPPEVQAIIDAGYKGVIAQGKKSVDSEGDCLYRAPDGCKCFIGHGIPDEIYSNDMENQSGSDIAYILGINPKFHEMLEKFQAAHDGAEYKNFISDFKSRCKLVAKEFNVTLPEITEHPI